MSYNLTNFFVTGGTLRRDAPSYVTRHADEELLQALLAGEFCYILTARQMGKSSLMVRTAERLRQQDAHLVSGPGPNGYLPIGMGFSFFLMWSLMSAITTPTQSRAASWPIALGA